MDIRKYMKKKDFEDSQAEKSGDAADHEDEGDIAPENSEDRRAISPEYSDRQNEYIRRQNAAFAAQQAAMEEELEASENARAAAEPEPVKDRAKRSVREMLEDEAKKEASAPKKAAGRPKGSKQKQDNRNKAVESDSGIAAPKKKVPCKVCNLFTQTLYCVGDSVFCAFHLI
jgi:hypothetical protein